MLMPIDIKKQLPRNRLRLRNLQHNGSRYSGSLGCAICPDQNVCGGLQVKGPVYNCLQFCCGNPENCDVVCRNRPREFARRVWEVDGFSLENVSRAPILDAPKLPKLVPTFYDGSRRREKFQASEAVCLPLYKVISRHDGRTRYANRSELAAHFQISSEMQVILTGTAVDPPLERWWSLGPGRLDAIRALRRLGIAMATTPNFSLYSDQPRWDDLHSMKRIAIVHEEFLREGLPAALHVNARTDRDWERWTEYISHRPEVTHIAFEFATGAGRSGRIIWHADHLVKLGVQVGRPLHLVVRGGIEVLPTLIDAFSEITVLETSTYVKTVKRKRAKLMPDGKIRWDSSLTAPNESLDSLLAENWELVATSYACLLGEMALAIVTAE